MADIKIIAIATEHVGRPSKDGTRGSSLYTVPLRLNARPSRLWAQLFREVWDHPPQWTTRHRPGIAHVADDEIVLDGTTIDEVRDVHLETLRHVLADVNRRAAEAEARRVADEKKRAADDAEHDRRVREVAEGLKFEE